MEKNYLRYLYALLAVPLAVLLRFALMPLTGPGIPYITLFPVTVAVALLAGLGPAILTGILGSIVIDYLFILPLHAVEFNVEGISRIAVVVLTSAFVGYAGDVLRSARKKAEKQAIELRDSQADLNRAQAVANTGSWRMDVKTNELTWSDEVYRMFGISKGMPLTYESFISFIHPDDRQFVDTKWKAALAGEKYDIEHRIVVNGQIKWVREKAELEFDNNGTLLDGFGTVTDITELKEAETTLLREKNFSNTTIDSMPGVFYLFNEQGQFLRWNKNFEKVTEYSSSEIAKTHPLDLFRGDDKKLIAESIQNVLEKGETIVEASFVTKNGLSIPYVFTGKRIMFDQKPCVVGMGVDITERKKAEETLRQSEIKYRTVADNTYDWEFWLDPQGRFIYCSPSCERITGYKPEEFFADPGLRISLVHPDDRSQFEKHLCEIENKHEGAAKGEWRYLRPDGTVCWVAHVCQPVYDDSGRFIGTRGNNRDITERKQMEDELRKSHDDLEKRVRERTAQLSETVETLEKAEKIIKAERKRFEDVLEMMPAYAILLTPDYHVAFANRTFRKWFGDDNGKKCYEFLFNRTEPCENCETYNVMKTGKSQFWEWTGPNGHNYDIYDYPFADTDGSPLIMEIGVDVTAHKQTQNTLRSTSLYARSLIEASLDPLVTISTDGKITDVNEATIKVTGVSRDKLVGTDFSNYFTEPQKAKEGYQQVFAKGFVTDYPLTIRNKDGRLTDVLYNASVYRDTRGKTIGVFAAARDVTVQKQASQYARSLIESSLDPLVTISADGKITDVNEATIKVTGISRQQLIGTDFSDYFTEPQNAREGYRQVFAKGFVTDYPLTIRHKNGRLTDVLYNASVYRDTRGKTIGVFAAARDITARKAAEKRQNATNLLLELLARKTTRKKYLDDAVKVIQDWSKCQFTGIRIRDNEKNIPYESCVGFDEKFLALENTLHLDSHKCICIRTILQRPQKQEQEFMTSGGSFFCNDSKAFLNGLSEQERKEYRGNCIKWGFQSIAVIPVRYNQEVMGAIHITDFQKDMVPLSKIQFIEATIAPLIGEAVQRFNAEAELEKYRLHLEEMVKQQTDELTRSNKDLEQFAYVASHDLQEPLRMIAGYTQLLQQRYKDKLDEDANQFIFYTVDGVVRMQNLITDLLTYSRLNTRSEALEPVDCSAVLDDVLAAMQMTIEENNAFIKYGTLPTIKANKGLLFQLFQNLISNAIKFRSDKPPLISITAKPQDKQWLFSVSDNGIGIEPQYLERIFVIFQRLHTREKYPGTGIGLAICKKIVERHGGRIWVESQPGKGSTFHFII